MKGRVWTHRHAHRENTMRRIASMTWRIASLAQRIIRSYFGHLMWRVDSLEKTLMLGGIGGRRRRGRQRMRWLDGITNSMDVFEWTPGVGDGQGGLACCNSWGCKELDMTEQLNWTELRRKIWNRSLSTFFRGSLILLTPWSSSLQNHETIVLLFKLLSLHPWIGKIPWRRAWQPTPYFCLENPIDRGAWQALVHRVTKSQIWLKRLDRHACDK